MELADFLRCAEDNLDRYYEEISTKGPEYCKMYLNLAGRDLMLAEINEENKIRTNERYQTLKLRLESLRNPTIYT